MKKNSTLFRKLFKPLALGLMLFGGVMNSQQANAQCGYAEGLGCSNTDYNNFGYNSNTNAATIEYDNYSSTFHSSIVREFDGSFTVWGEFTNSNGGTITAPEKINKTNFPGIGDYKVLKATMGSNAQNSNQTFVLTTENKIWYWGNGNNTPVVTNTNNSNAYSNTNMRSMDLPTGVSYGDVKQLYAVPRSLAIVTCEGNVWVRSQDAAMRGVDGNGTQHGWNKVQMSGGGDLGNVIALRGGQHGFLALTEDNNGNQGLWTWGTRTYIGSGNSSSRNTATSVSVPSGLENNIKMIAVTTHATGNNAQIAYYVLGKNKALYAMGSNGGRQLGTWNTTNSNTWIRPRYNSSSGPVMDDIVWISGSDHDNFISFVNVINDQKELYNWGLQSGFCLGRSNLNPPTMSTAGAAYSSSGEAYDPGMPMFGYGAHGSTSPKSVLAVESGGHTTMISAECEANFGYVGHFTAGSMGTSNIPSGTLTSGSGSNTFYHVPYFTFETTGLQPCGAFAVPLIDIAGEPIIENGEYCGQQIITLNGLPTNGNFSIASGSGEIINGNQLKFTGTSGTVVVSMVIPGMCDDMVTTKEFVYTDCDMFTVSGTVWVDINKNVVLEANEEGTNLEGVLWANLVDDQGKVVAKVTVNNDGTYELGTLVGGEYSVVITKSEVGMGTVISSTAKELPEDWEYTGNTDGTNICDVTVTCVNPYEISGIELGTTNTSVTDIDFGIYRINTTYAVNDENSTWVNTPVSGDVTTNDFDLEENDQAFKGFRDHNGNLVDDYDASTGKTTMIVYDEDGTTPLGEIEFKNDGTYTFTPAEDYVGTVTIPYSVCDNGYPEACDDAVLEITVDDMPYNENSVIANNDEYFTMGEDVEANWFVNDADPQGDDFEITKLTYIDENGTTQTITDNSNLPSITAIPVSGYDQDNNLVEAGTLLLDKDGNMTFSPKAGFEGNVPMTYEITDNYTGDVAKDVADVVITVVVDPNNDPSLPKDPNDPNYDPTKLVNNPPVAGDDFVYTNVNQPKDGDFVNNDSDMDGDALSMKDANDNPVTIDETITDGDREEIRTLTTEKGGTVTFYNNGTYTYNPPAGYVGPDYVVYEVCDVTTVAPQPLCTEATIHMLIGIENTTNAVNDENSTWVNTPVSGDVRTNDYDKEDHTQDNPVYKDQDNPENDMTFTTDADGNMIAPVTGNDGTNTNVPAGNFVIHPDGTYTFEPNATFTGTVTIPYSVCDNGRPVACADAVLEITVNDLPQGDNSIIANNDEYTTTGTTPVEANVTVNDADPQGDAFEVTEFTYTKADGTKETVTPGGSPVDVYTKDENGDPVKAGTFEMDEDGDFTFVPEEGFTGEVPVDYTICDKNLPSGVNTACDDATIVITVNEKIDNINNPPVAGDDFSYTEIDTPVDGNFLANDSDPDNNPVSMKDEQDNPVTIDSTITEADKEVIKTVTTNEGGTMTFYDNGTYTYTPKEGYVGPDYVVYEICDVTTIEPQPLCTKATIHTLVAPGNTLAGTVYHDADGMKDNSIHKTTIGETTAEDNDGTNISGAINAVLTDNTGKVLQVVAVGADGKYEFENVPSGNDYNIYLRTDSPEKGNTITEALLPEHWMSTGEIIGVVVGNDGAIDGMNELGIPRPQHIEHIDFGVQKAPIADPYNIHLNTSPNVANINVITLGQPFEGTNTSLLTGTDLEDGDYTGEDYANELYEGVVITALPSVNNSSTNTIPSGDLPVLKYNGTPVTQAQIDNGFVFENPSLFSLELNGLGYNEVEFKYAYVDRAGAKGQAATYKFNWDHPLPIELLSFDAIKEGQTAHLVWVTAGERNNGGFNIERSGEGTNWTNIGYVRTQAEDGNSVEELTYNFIDASPLVGQNFYRLQQVDLDGSSTYSEVRVLYFDTKSEAVVVYPNPTTNVVNIKGLGQDDVIQVYDNLGRMLIDHKAESAIEVIDLAGLANGMYQVVIIDANGEKQTVQIVLTK